jgi:serine protease AprX
MERTRVRAKRVLGKLAQSLTHSMFQYVCPVAFEHAPLLHMNEPPTLETPFFRVNSIFTPLFRNELEEQKLTLTKMGVFEEPYLHQGDFEVYAAQIHNMEEAISLASLSFIDRLELMPIYIPTGSSIINIANLRLRINTPLNELPIVAIVDSGIDPNSPLEPLVYAREMCVTQKSYNPSHGTSVAALAAASDGLVGSTLIPRCRLLDVTIIDDAEPLYEDLLIRRLEIAVEKYCDVKHWNMSLATTPGSRSTTFSDLAMALDDLQKRYDVTFVCAAGNNPQYRRQWPPASNSSTDWWVSPPGDTVCGITVGSYTGDNTPDNALAPNGAPSPFSPRGPVAYSIIKPDLLEVGGNIAGDGTDIGVTTIQRNGDPCLISGTSFATPRVCGVSAEINACVSQSSTAGYTNPQLLAKALMLHHAKIPGDFALADNFRPSDYYGYGVPSSLEETIGDPFWRSTTLIYGRLYPDGEDIVIDDFPYPDGLRSNKRSWGQIWITMTSNPIVDPSFKTEYVRSNVDVHFGTVRQGKFKGEARLVHAGSGGEMSLIREQHKWSPIKQYRSSLHLDCLGNYWLLRIGLTLREKESKLIREGANEVEDYPVDFVSVVTIADPQHLVPVNNQIFQQWRLRGYVPVSIGVTPRLRTRFAMNSDNS